LETVRILCEERLGGILLTWLSGVAVLSLAGATLGYGFTHVAALR